MLFLSLTAPHTGSSRWFGQRGKIRAQIPIFPPKSFVHVMKAPQNPLSTHSGVCALADCALDYPCPCPARRVLPYSIVLRAMRVKSLPAARPRLEACESE
jgi:hypothetical protein